MDTIISEMKVGGYDKLDDAKYTGGKTVSLPFIRGEKKIQLSVGNNTSLIIRNRISNWRTFINVFWSDGISHEEQLAKVVGEVLGINTTGFSVDEILQLFTGLQKIPILKCVYNSFGFRSHIVSALRSIFMIWTQHIETLILQFDHARTRYVKKGVVVNDIKKLMSKWRESDEKHNIHTSSKLILFSLLPDLSKLSWVQSKKWSTPPPKFHWDVPIKSVNAFLDEVKARDFYYPGFCPKEPIKRLKLLLKFPIKLLIEAIIELNGSVKTDYSSMLTRITNIKIRDAPDILDDMRLSSLPDQKTLNVQYGIKSTKYPKSVAIRWCMDNYLDQLKSHTSELKKLEDHHLHMVESIIKVGDIIREGVYGHRAE